MAKPKMQYFELHNGQRRAIDEETLNISKFGKYTSTNYGKDVDTNLTLPVDPNEYAFLKTNPFLITWNRSNEDYKNYTFDEFIIRYKDMDYRFGEFINSKRISLGKKKRVIRKLFDKWDEEFKNKKDASIQKVNSNLSLAQDLYYEPKSFTYLVVMFLIVVFLLVCILTPSIVFTNLDTLIRTNIFTRIQNKLDFIHNDFKISLVVAIASALFGIVYMVSHVVHNVNCSKAKSFIGEHREWMAKNNRKIAEKYRKNFKKVRKYYLNNVNRQCRPFPPYRLKNIDMNTTVDSFDRLNVAVVNKTHHYRSAIKNGRKFANMIFAFTIILIIIYCLLVVYKEFL